MLYIELIENKNYYGAKYFALFILEDKPKECPQKDSNSG